MNAVWEENEQNCVVCVKMIYISTHTNTCINKYVYIFTHRFIKTYLNIKILSFSILRWQQGMQ